MPKPQKLTAHFRRITSVFKQIPSFLRSKTKAILRRLPTPIKRSRFIRQVRSMLPIHRRRKIYAVCGGLLLLFFIIGFLFPARATFSYAQNTCVFVPQILPALTHHEPSERYASQSIPAISVFNYPILSFQTCVEITHPPQPGTTEKLQLTPLKNPLFHKQITVSTPNLPEVTASFDPSQAISTKGSLEFTLSNPDTLFWYYLKAGEHTSTCSVIDTTISCEISLLKLAQGQTHQVRLERHFYFEQQTVVFEQPLTTLDPVIVTESSITEGATVYHDPTELVIRTNKPLGSVGSITMQHAETKETLSSNMSNLAENELRLSFTDKLPRKTPVILTIADMTAQDGSQLDQAFALTFVTSGGPKVTRVSVGNKRVQPTNLVTLGFDIGLKDGQDLQKFVRIEHAGKSLPATITTSGDSVSIRLGAQLARCSDYKIVVSPGLVNQHDIGDGEAWQHTFKTICQEAFSIGRSVQGRAISAYKFGTGSSLIVYVGGMHGNEKSSVATMNAWINYLEDNAHSIPAHRSVVVIPNHNPDAYARSSRTNANNVDLNRNFPNPDWRPDVQMPGGQNLPEGGGKAPLDQPESAALASYIRAQRPRLVLTYHAVARVVISNDVGDSIALGQAYARTSGYGFSTNAAADSGGTFDYATTGEFEDWVGNVLGRPALLIELASMSRNELSTHQRAMWDIVQLP